ncbi:hypothetical protein EYF80_064970 [Liparis tanakae]|uniref:Uncharacterized protein n=1 Tax=Liparis tanakae TaxID=230148 RepID=A0A4Z2E994_9TELE|nr:hypothetical protein EYF80_064970 [Liparis tanakae]
MEFTLETRGAVRVSGAGGSRDPGAGPETRGRGQRPGGGARAPHLFMKPRSWKLSQSPRTSSFLPVKHFPS